MPSPVLDFYEQLVDNYHLYYDDWMSTALQDGKVIDKLIKTSLGPSALSVLDCSCGIGTQAIGLAVLGYKVHASDFSPRAVMRAAQEASRAGVSISVQVADFRTLDEEVAGHFDTVLTFDNALPHLLAEEELLATCKAMKSKLTPAGMLLISVRDYDSILQARDLSAVFIDGPEVFCGAEGRRIVFQTWDWSPDGREYSMTLFLLRQVGNEWCTSCFTTPYRALLRAELEHLLAQAGFTNITWHMPDETGFYQPIVSARA